MVLTFNGAYAIANVDTRWVVSCPRLQGDEEPDAFPVLCEAESSQMVRGPDLPHPLELKSGIDSLRLLVAYFTES